MIPLRRLARYVVISAAVARGILRAVLVGVALVSCHPFHNAVMAVTPGVPSSTTSVAAVGASRCNGAVPEARSEGRWWPSMPAGAPCPAGCLYDDGPDGGAYCAPVVDAGAP